VLISDKFNLKKQIMAYKIIGGKNYLVKTNVQQDTKGHLVGVEL